MKAVLLASYFTALTLQVRPFFLLTHEKGSGSGKENLNRWTLEVMLTSMSMLTPRKLMRRPKRKRQKVKMMVTGLLGGRSLAQGSERKLTKLEISLLTPAVIYYCGLQ